MCNAILADVGSNQPFPGTGLNVFDAKIDQDEQALLTGWFGNGLNQALEDLAAKHNWTYVSEPWAYFGAFGHGYCGSDPPPYSTYHGNAPGPYTDIPLWQPDRLIGRRIVAWPSPAGARWFRKGTEASAMQGPPGARLETTGTMHPNELGHLKICEFLEVADCTLANR